MLAGVGPPSRQGRGRRRGARGLAASSERAAPGAFPEAGLAALAAPGTTPYGAEGYGVVVRARAGYEEET
eukprot:85918-Alexandrium_andersonii.AAC.1